MATELELRVNIKSADFEYIGRQLSHSPLLIRKAISSAINKVLPKSRKILVDRIQETTTIKSQAKMYRKIKPTYATVKKLSGSILLEGRPVGAINFKFQARKKFGVTVRFGKRESIILFRHGFRGVGIRGDGTLASGNRHLWLRIPGTKHMVVLPHYEQNEGRMMDLIRPIYGPRIGTLFRRDKTIRMDAESVVRQEVPKIVRSQVDWLLNRKKPDPKL